MATLEVELDSLYEQIVKQSGGALLLNARLAGEPGVELPEPSHLLALLGLNPRILYLHQAHLDDDAFDAMFTRPRDDEPLGDELHQLRADARAYLGQAYLLEAAVVLDGLAHRLQVLPSWFEDLSRRHAELTARNATLSDEQYEHEAARERARADALDRWFDALPARLLEDEAYLACKTENTRKQRVRDLLRREHPGVDQSLNRIKSQIVTASELAFEGRPEVLSRRRAELDARLDELAVQLAADPEFAAATRREQRLRLARDVLQSVDPLAFAPQLAERLEALALRARTAASAGLF